MPDPEVSPHDAVSKDIASDAAGEPRTKEAPLPPPGTVATKFIESGGFKAAVVATTVVLNLIWRPFVIAWGESVLGDGQGAVLAAGLEIAVWAWLAAFGIQATAQSLRYK